MVGLTRYLMLDLDQAERECESAVDIALRTGHQRAAIIAHHGACLCALMRLDLAAAEARALTVSALTERIGARRFEAENQLWLAESRLLAGDRSAALEIATAAMAISRETAIGFVGPAVLGLIAWATGDAAERGAAIAEAEDLLARGAVSHNHLFFRRYAIEAALEGADWDGAARHADALRAYTAVEPLPWAELVAARGHTLATHGRGQGDLGELVRVRDDAARHGLAALLPALDAALVQAPP
jgi:hypothetical protein